MRLLLDTHVAIWSVSSSHRLPQHIIDLLSDPDNEVFVSIVSLWEIALKSKSAARNPMPFPAAVGAFRFAEFGYSSLALLPTHVFRFEDMERLHGDPFDRILVAQALVEQLQLVTRDAELAGYQAELIVF